MPRTCIRASSLSWRTCPVPGAPLLDGRHSRLVVRCLSSITTISIAGVQAGSARSVSLTISGGSLVRWNVASLTLGMSLLGRPEAVAVRGIPLRQLLVPPRFADSHGNAQDITRRTARTAQTQAAGLGGPGRDWLLMVQSRRRRRVRSRNRNTLVAHTVGAFGQRRVAGSQTRLATTNAANAEDRPVFVQIPDQLHQHQSATIAASTTLPPRPARTGGGRTQRVPLPVRVLPCVMSAIEPSSGRDDAGQQKRASSSNSPRHAVQTTAYPWITNPDR